MAKNKGFGKGFKKEQERKGVFTPIPPGRYFLQCIVSKDEENSKNTGYNFKTDWKVIKGEHKERVIKVSCSYDNPSEQAVEIANAEIASMCDAAGVKFEKFTDPKQMLKKKIQAEVGVEAPEKGSKYGPKNIILQYLDYDSDLPEDEEKEPKKEKKKGKKKDKPF